MLLLPVLVTGEELLLLGVEQPHHVPLRVRGVETVSVHGDPPPPAPRPSPLTPFSVSSLLSLHFMNRTIFQLVLQLTELTCKGTRVLPHSPLVTRRLPVPKDGHPETAGCAGSAGPREPAAVKGSREAGSV